MSEKKLTWLELATLLGTALTGKVVIGAIEGVLRAVEGVIRIGEKKFNAAPSFS